MRTNKIVARATCPWPAPATLSSTPLESTRNEAISKCHGRPAHELKRSDPRRDATQQNPTKPNTNSPFYSPIFTHKLPLNPMLRTQHFARSFNTPNSAKARHPTRAGVKQSQKSPAATAPSRFLRKTNPRSTPALSMSHNAPKCPTLQKIVPVKPSPASSSPLRPLRV
jgi:hypothetical protein